MQTNLAQQLLEKYQQDNCTPDEEALLALWFESLDHQPEQFSGLDKNRLALNMKMHIDLATGKSKRKTGLLLQRLAIAASIILFLAIALYFMKPARPLSPQLLTFADQVQPGGQKAYLILANGKRISLNDAGNGRIAMEAGMEITKTAQGQLSYVVCRSCNQDEARNTDHPVFNTIETPRGGTYRLSLPDGTQVWLNSGAVIKYPVRFTTIRRSVELSGEAYFEVSKDPVHPFVVQTTGQETEVLGTHFNLSSYANESSIKTTLLEGSLKITNLSKSNKAQGAASVVIKPGQQTILTGGELKVHSVDAEDAVGWKEGLFIFDEEPLSEVMFKISRWYDVDIRFDQNKLKTTRFSGSISKKLSLTKTLEKLSLAGGINFGIDHKTIVVYKK